MGNREIKSSIELAMEKVAQMSKLSPEELAEQQRKEYAPLGRALAIKFLEGRLSEEALQREIAQYEGEPSGIVRGALLSTLKEELSLDEVDKNQRAFEALAVLQQDIEINSIKENIDRVVAAYQEEKAQTQAQYEQEYRSSLQRRGISGSALRLNLEDARGLKTRLDKLRQVHGDRLMKILDEQIQT